MPNDEAIERLRACLARGFDLVGWLAQALPRADWDALCAEAEKVAKQQRQATLEAQSNAVQAELDRVAADLSTLADS